MTRLALAAAVAMLSCRTTPPRTVDREVEPVDDDRTTSPPIDQPQETTTVSQIAKPQELVFPDEAFRAEQPRPGKPRPFRLPEIKPFTLASGTKVFLVEQHALPLVSIDLSFDGGSMSDPPGKEGLASVCMAMLSEGTESLDKVALAEALADVAASIDSGASSETQSVSMSSLTKHLDTVFPLFVDVLLRPGMRQADFDRMIKRRKESLRQVRGAAGSIADRVKSPILYGAKHPFGRITSEAAYDAITLDDCRAYHKKWLRPGGARLFVVGDLTEAQIRGYFDGDALASWKGKVPKSAKLPTPSSLPGRIFFVDVPGAKQSNLTVLHFGPQRRAKDYLETSLMSAVLGGGFSGRLQMNLREDKGYTYGARSGFGYSRNYGVFSATTSVVSEATYQALLEIAREVADLKAGHRAATDDEIAREKSGAVLAMPARFATASGSLATFRGLVYYGLPLDYYATYVQKLEAVTAKQIHAAAKKHLRPDQAVYVVVGDGTAPVNRRNGTTDEPLERDGRPLTLLEALRDLADTGALGKGGLVVLDADANVI
jgi:zinc protease